MERRKLLKIGGTVAGSPLITSIMSANARASGTEQEFVGCSYDSLTHMEQQRCAAKLRRSNEGIKVDFDVGGFQIEIGDDEFEAPKKTKNNWPVYYYKSFQKKHMKDDLPLKMRFTDTGTCISGYLTRPSRSFSKLGFTLGDRANNATYEKSKQGLLNQGEGVAPSGHNDAPNVPKAGIPENTSIKQLRTTGGDHQ